MWLLLHNYPTYREYTFYLLPSLRSKCGLCDLVRDIVVHDTEVLKLFRRGIAIDLSTDAKDERSPRCNHQRP